MTALVNDLLDVSRVTRGLVDIEREDVDVKAVVAGAVEQVRPLIEARGHELVLRIGAAHARVLGDRTRLAGGLLATGRSRRGNREVPRAHVAGCQDPARQRLSIGR